MSHVSTNKHVLILLFGALLLAFGMVGLVQAGHHEEKAAEPTPEEKILGLEEMCAANAEAMATRQSEKSLYERLGGEEKITAIVTEIVRLHDENPSFDRFMPDVDKEHLIKMVSQFLVAGSGGPAKYTGKGMPEAHAHLKLTNSDFLAAGGDVMQAMKNMGCGENEIQEVVCTLVSLRAAVVIDSDKALQ